MYTRYTAITLSFLLILAIGITAAMPLTSAHDPNPKRSPRPSSQESSASTQTCLTTMYVVDFSGYVYSIETTTNTLYGTPIKIGEKPGSVVMNPAATTLYVTNNGGGISAIDIASREVTQSIADTDVPANITMTADGSTLYVSNVTPAGITAIDTSTGVTTTTTLPPLATPDADGNAAGAYGIAVTPDGATIYVGAFSGSDQNIYVLDTASMLITSTIYVDSQTKGLTMSPSGSQLWVTGNSTNSAIIVSTDTNAILAQIPAGSSPERITFAPSGETVWVANLGSDNVTVIDADTFAVLATYPAGNAPFDVAFNGGGTTAYISNSVGSVTALDTSNGKKITTIGGFEAPDNMILGPGPCAQPDIAKSTCKPTSKPTGKPTGKPSCRPTSKPTSRPTSKPTASPNVSVTRSPSPVPSSSTGPSAGPSAPSPTAKYTPRPTALMTGLPSPTATTSPGNKR